MSFSQHGTMSSLVVELSGVYSSLTSSTAANPPSEFILVDLGVDLDWSFDENEVCFGFGVKVTSLTARSKLAMSHVGISGRSSTPTMKPRLTKPDTAKRSSVVNQV